jgi:putative oxidoreductase
MESKAFEEDRQPAWKAAMAWAGTGLVGALFVVSGLLKIGRFDGVASVLAAKGVPLASLALACAIALEIVAGLALIVRIRVQWAAAALVLFVAAATLLFHAFWSVDAAAFQNQLNHFLKNIAIAGALLALAVRRP